MGAAGGATVSVIPSNTSSGNPGNLGISPIFQTNGGSAPSISAIGPGGAVPSPFYSPFNQFLLRYAKVLVGSGGASGEANSNASGNATSGVGGNGGGALIIECGGAWNFTTTNGISVAGQNGGTGTQTSAAHASGGGGGSGGFFLALYSALTANTGTINVSGGTGGNNSPHTGGADFGGGGGGLIVAGSDGTSSSTGGAKTGGDGAAGFSLIALNTEFS
jgi:hypothetical protein